LSRIALSAPGEPGSLRWWQVYTGIGLTTLATLVLELTLTRLFSVVFYYHFAFLAISIALFGLGAGGVFSYVAGGWRGGLFAKLGWIALATAASTLLALQVVLEQRGDGAGMAIALVYFASALPFFFSGIVVSLVIARTVERVDRVYFYDLLGAAGGCLLVLPLLNAFGAPNALITVAVLFAAAGAVWFNLAKQPMPRAAAVVAALGLVLLLTANLRWNFLDVRYAKGQTLAKEKFVKWNGQSRISVVEDEGAGGHLIVIDADASTGVPAFDFNKLTDKQLKDLLLQGPGLPFGIRPGAKTLIIGPGGGWDVSRALASGSKDITGVEINPIIGNTIMRRRFPELSRNLYLRPEVKIEIEDGRSFVRRTLEKYQVLQLTLVDTWASTAAGAFALSENNLYTSDAFYDYLSHLTEDGFLAFTRWGFDPPRESLRLLTLADSALLRLGELDAARHVIIVREGSTEGWGAKDTVLISRKPFSDQDIARTSELAALGGFEVIYLPGYGKDSEFRNYLTSRDKNGYLASYRYDVRPVSDDRPFFFYTVQPGDLWGFLTQSQKDSADYKINRAVPLIFSLAGVSLAAVAVILFLPPMLLQVRLPDAPGTRPLLGYFLAIGVGYILVQVTLIQKFVLFLGHPAYALTIVVFSMLVASSLGSSASGRSWARRAPAAVAALLLALPLTFGVTSWGAGWPWIAKAAATVLLIAPVSYLMGMPFPQGLTWMERRHPGAVQWAWSVNAAASVLGSAGAIILSIYLGISLTLVVAAGCYALAAGLSGRATDAAES
jgi:hypothetical protein